MQNTPSIAPEVRLEIESRLARVAGEDDVRLLMAVESGSRAWGFPSPDSDYDVRFLYVRPRSAYLGLTPLRDVIERPIVDEIDLNGWDIRKALGLLLKHNAVLSEWIESPIRYINDDSVVPELAELCSRHFNPRGYAKHYASLGKRSVERWFDSEGNIAAKRYFYALRPALSVRALRLDPSKRPPMSMQPLMQAADLAPVIVEQINVLIARKAETKEAGNTIRLPEIEQLVQEELNRTDEVPERLEQTEIFTEEAEALFIELVDR
ncbi:nucleotidyltransferase domain-containing protein [Qipengyuania sp. DGS5-3]|uniref:nucleotidyltransferase domain-containing protein n=1 Tax=Qipengyuania sp. DGS5-3 TaxID=3349632 RepID=UPI0036D2D6EC